MPLPCIAVVEDDHALRDDLVDFLNLRGFQAVGAGSASQCWQVLDAHPVQLILLDIGLPDQSGLALAPLLRTRHPDVGIVMLTAFGEDMDRIEGLRGGADAYLVKGTSLEVIEATCHSVWRRLSSLPTAHTSLPIPESESKTSAPAWQLHPTTCTVIGPNGRAAVLTIMEFGFLQAVMATPGQVQSRTALLTALSRPDTLNNLRNLDGCAARLRRKIMADIGCELPLRSFYARGYIFTGEIPKPPEPGA